MCHVSHVVCHMSPVTCRVSPVKCNMYFFGKLVELVVVVVVAGLVSPSLPVHCSPECHLVVEVSCVIEDGGDLDLHVDLGQQP